MISESDARHLVQRVSEAVSGRDAEVRDLLGLLGQRPSYEPPACVLVHGDAGVGKTLLVSQCLALGGFRHALADCLEAYSLRLLFRLILDQLSGHRPTRDNSFQSSAKCGNFVEFVAELRAMAARLGVGQRLADSPSLVVVLDRAERLRTLGRHVLPAFLKLRELSGLKLCVVLVSALPWPRFSLPCATTEPIALHVPQYTQKQILTILQKDKPEDKFYENYLNLFLSIFYQACRDVGELKYQAAVNFEHYEAPVRRGEVSRQDANALWKRAQPQFKKSLRSLYLKMDPGLEPERLTSVATQALGMELPFYSKYLLLGAYIASFNPASSDKRLFVKNHGKVKKSARARAPAAKLHLLGPKPFGLQRLFAIVSAILNDDRFSLNADLFVEVASLVRLNLLTQVGDDVLDSPTFKCNVGLAFIDVIAKNVQFPVRKYLVDFMDA